MPKSPKQRQDAFRENLKALGRFRWEIFVTDEEKARIKEFLTKLRKGKTK